MVVVGKSSSDLPVSEIMTPQSKLMTVSPAQSVVDVMKLMIDNNFRHVPVVRSSAVCALIRADLVSWSVFSALCQLALQHVRPANLQQIQKDSCGAFQNSDGHT